jgi:hypothetical protein
MTVCIAAAGGQIGGTGSSGLDRRAALIRSIASL